MNNVIEVENIRKVYGSTVAVDDISLTVEVGEIFCILGPNGAGKSTAVESIMGLRKPDQGRIRVLGLDPQGDNELRQKIGIQLQQANIPDRLKVWETLDLFSSFYDKTVSWEKLLEDWGLTEKRNTAFGNLSGGQKQRLFIALALLNDPEIVFLDELTTGLDPQARRATWEQVSAIREKGKTVVLVTHFMDEAEELADRVAIIDNGRIVATDTPSNLIEALKAGNRVRFTMPEGLDAASLELIDGVTAVEQNGKQIIVHGNGPLLANVATGLATKGITPADLHVEKANLEDVFLAHTGRKIRA
ncbi:MAG: ABC transporter ATP-binding protein [Chloroflexota bacterium]